MNSSLRFCSPLSQKLNGFKEIMIGQTPPGSCEIVMELFRTQQAISIYPKLNSRKISNAPFLSIGRSELRDFCLGQRNDNPVPYQPHPRRNSSDNKTP
ncbi:MAG: hypothetical protein ACJAUZ_001971, partial [Flavobacteriaceae bacterium]